MLLPKFHKVSSSAYTIFNCNICWLCKVNHFATLVYSISFCVDWYTNYFETMLYYITAFDTFYNYHKSFWVQSTRIDFETRFRCRGGQIYILIGECCYSYHTNKMLSSLFVKRDCMSNLRIIWLYNRYIINVFLICLTHLVAVNE